MQDTSKHSSQSLFSTPPTRPVFALAQVDTVGKYAICFREDPEDEWQVLRRPGARASEGCKAVAECVTRFCTPHPSVRP